MFKWWPLAFLAIALLSGGCAQQGSEAEKGAGGGQEQRGGGVSEREPEQHTVEVAVPAGTTFAIALDQALSSKTNSAGDPVRAHLVGELSSEGEVVARDGAEVRGVVAQVEGSDRVKGRAILGLNFTSIETVSGTREVQTAMVEGPLEAKGTKKRDAAIIVGGTAAGAVLGEILGDSPKLGAVIGAAAGTGVVLATKGKELEVEPGTQLNLQLVNALRVPVSHKASSPS